MQAIHLLVKDDFVEQFIDMLPRDKVSVIEEDFKNNKNLFQKELQNYKDSSIGCRPYYESMKLMGIWLQKREK